MYNLHHVLDSIRQPGSKPRVSDLYSEFNAPLMQAHGILFPFSFKTKRWSVNWSIPETKLFFRFFYQGLPGLRSLLKGESVSFERNIFRIQKWWQSSMSIPHCRATCFMPLPLPCLWLTSFASWHGVSVSSLLLILQDSNNFSSFICPRLFFSC